MTVPLRMGVLLSGSGRTLENFLRRVASGELPAQVVVVASDRAGVRGVKIAHEADLPVRIFSRKEYSSRIERDARMLAWMHGFHPSVFCLAGYLSLLDLTEIRSVPVLNIHPALLPRFGGKGYWGERVHSAVLEAKEKFSGATVHLVNERFDEGAILGRIQVPVQPQTSKTKCLRIFVPCWVWTTSGWNCNPYNFLSKSAPAA